MKTRNSHGLLQLGWEALAYCQCASALISGNKALFVSVDLIGEKSQVILEYVLIHSALELGKLYVCSWLLKSLTYILCILSFVRLYMLLHEKPGVWVLSTLAEHLKFLKVTSAVIRFESEMSLKMLR